MPKIQKIEKVTAGEQIYHSLRIYTMWNMIDVNVIVKLHSLVSELWQNGQNMRWEIFETTFYVQLVEGVGV